MADPTEERSRQVAEYVGLLKAAQGQSYGAHVQDDPEHADQWNSCALIAGTFVASVTPDHPFATGVDIPTDLEGNYLNHVVVTTRGGNRVRVTFTPEV